MLNVRIIVLTLACIGLGALVWLDNRPQPATEIASQNHAVNGADGDAIAADPPAARANPDSDSSDVNMDASDYITQPETSISNPLSTLEIGNLRDTIERPLFASSRRRPPDAEARSPIASAEPAKAATFELLGVAIGGSQSIAVLRKKSDGTSFRVQAGDTLAGWQVSKVEPHFVLLERAEGPTETVPLLRK